MKPATETVKMRIPLAAHVTLARIQAEEYAKLGTRPTMQDLIEKITTEAAKARGVSVDT
jgi:hypothetical protein